MLIQEVRLSPRPIHDEEHGTFYMVLCQVTNVGTSLQSSYKFHTDTNTIRRFTDATIPSFLKVKLAMIRASISNKYLPDSFAEPDCYRWREATKNNPEFKYIGWQISDTLFVIVCDKDELSQLRGYNDTREKSQRESKEET